MRKADEEAVQLALAKNKLQTACMLKRRELNNNAKNLTKEKRDGLLREIGAIVDWVDSPQRTKKEIEDKLNEFNRQFN